MTRPSATAARTESATGPVNVPIARPVPRRIQRSWLGLGLALVALGALSAFFLWTRFGPANEYLAITKAVPVGTQVTADDLAVVRINSAPGLNPMTSADLGQAVGKVAAVDLVPGTLLTRAQLTDKAVPAPGEQLVGLALGKDRLPGQPLSPGDKVVLVVTANQNPIAGTDPKAAQTAPRTFTATVHRVSTPDSRGGTVLDVIVNQQDGPTIAALAAEGRIVVLLAPRQS